MKRLIVIISLLIGCNCYALTPSERKIVEHANEFLQKAKEDAHRQQAIWEEADRRAQEAETHAAQTDVEIGKTKAQIDVSHKNEQALSLAVQKYKPVYDKVTSYWGIGGILFGFGLLAKHLLILAAVLIALAVGVWVLSFFFPAIGVGLSLAWSFLSSVFKKKA